MDKCSITLITSVFKISFTLLFDSGFEALRNLYYCGCVNYSSTLTTTTEVLETQSLRIPRLSSFTMNLNYASTNLITQVFSLFGIIYRYKLYVFMKVSSAYFTTFVNVALLYIKDIYRYISLNNIYKRDWSLYFSRCFQNDVYFNIIIL